MVLRKPDPATKEQIKEPNWMMGCNIIVYRAPNENIICLGNLTKQFGTSTKYKIAYLAEATLSSEKLIKFAIAYHAMAALSSEKLIKYATAYHAMAGLSLEKLITTQNTQLCNGLR